MSSNKHTYIPLIIILVIGVLFLLTVKEREVPIILNVPIVSQLPELPTGCEVAAITMVLNYNNININKVELAYEMPLDNNNPNYGYVGNPFTKHGWTINPPALMSFLKQYLNSSLDMTGFSLSAIEKQIIDNKPVVTWCSGFHGFTVHTIVITGFNESYFYYNDPWTGEKNKKISKLIFKKQWEEQGCKAISY
ncbi:hypothetical protein AZF37_09815 (plasmid) [endosymbiont 'TC1' of Trimyema compressum]|uniref:C39 family peptidase n=1 Tax=endosymbiont 'TC1' of Trimyema compressum TaxID=243899 RepID=UPI0007F14B65|nr:C39 family peptidase [endosymbiont 'TC1' of Trimyema compressum]AMP21468.1 hypothetical protein AZF37_09815 [endosymbiont 'TC1' of Trimyema compressum]